MFRKYFLLPVLLSLSFFFIFSAYAQEGPAALEDKEVNAIDILGNKTVSVATLLPKIKTTVGAKYSINVARDDIKRLYALGFFDDVRIDLKEIENKVKVVFFVTEKPVIDDISFVGTRKISWRVLETSMKTKKGLYLDKQQLRSDLEEIKRVYSRKGYSNVAADFDSIVDEEKNKVSIKIKIDEGLASRIKIVSMDGNSTFSDSRLINLIKSKPAKWWLFRKGYLDDSLLNEDTERLLAFYRSEGFIDVKIDKEVIKLKQKGLFKTIFKINEGKRYYVGEVKVDGNEIFSSQEIKKQLKVMTPEHVFSQDSLESDKFNLRSFYMDKGYIFAKIEGSTSLNQQTGKIDVNFDIQESELVYVNLIKIKGNVKTKDLVIRRELRIKPGERFDGDKLRRSKERLYNLGFFDELEGIDFDIEPTQEKNKSNLVVQVKETHTGNFSFGGGYSTIDQFVGFVEVEQKNFDWKNFPYFTGAGQNLRFRASLGTITESFDLSFTEPWLFDYPVSFGFDAFKLEHSRDTDVGYGYNEKRTGGDLRLGKEFSDYWRVDSTYRLEEIKIGDIEDNASDDLKKEEGTNVLNTIGLSATFDNRDNVFDTHKGVVFYNSVECTGGPFGGDKNYSKLWNSTSLYLPMPKNSALSFMVRSGIANYFGDSRSVPIYDRFFAGGSDTIRGYNERKVGPIDSVTEDPIGGQAILVGNIEYIYPVWKYMKVALFTDSGNVWKKTSDFASGGYKSSVGVGVRVKTPLGPMKLDYGFPLNLEPGKSDKTGKLHFSFSRGF